MYAFCVLVFLFNSKAFLLYPLWREYVLGVVFELQVPPTCSSLRIRGLLSCVENSLSSLLRERVQGKSRFSSFPKTPSPIPWVDYLTIAKNRTVRSAGMMSCHLPVTPAGALHRENGYPSSIYLFRKCLSSIYRM